MSDLEIISLSYYAVVAIAFGTGLVIGGNSKDEALPWWVVLMCSLGWPVALPFVVGISFFDQ